jgi:hypothetical protein
MKSNVVILSGILQQVESYLNCFIKICIKVMSYFWVTSGIWIIRIHNSWMIYSFDLEICFWKNDGNAVIEKLTLQKKVKLNILIHSHDRYSFQIDMKLIPNLVFPKKILYLFWYMSKWLSTYSIQKTNDWL